MAKLPDIEIDEAIRRHVGEEISRQVGEPMAALRFDQALLAGWVVEGERDLYIEFCRENPEDAREVLSRRWSWVL